MLCLDVIIDGELQCTVGTAAAGVTFASVTLTTNDEHAHAGIMVRALETLGVTSEELRWLAQNLREGQEVTIRLRDADPAQITVPRRVHVQGPDDPPRKPH